MTVSTQSAPTAGLVERTPKERYAIDHIRTTDDRISIAGWFLDSGDFETIRIICDDRTLHLPHADEWQQPSLDVAASTEPRYNAVRFNIIFPFPEDLSLALLKAIEISFEKEGHISRIPLLPLESSAETHLANKPLRELKLGIGIPTYNRSDLIAETVERVKALTQFDPIIFVANDGSKDNTSDILETIEGIHVLNAENKGIAWNKNRLLFHLHEIEKCDIVLLLEDDTQPVTQGWNVDWILACLSFGHVNFSPPWFPHANIGNGSWHAPYFSDALTAQCSGFSREALSYVGYIDTRFGRYGHEHVEHTSRMIRMGYGGLTKEDGASKSFFLLQGGLEIKDSVSNFSQEHVDENAQIFQKIHSECAYRSPWRDDEQIMRLRDEMKKVKRQ